MVAAQVATLLGTTGRVPAREGLREHGKGRNCPSDGGVRRGHVAECQGSWASNVLRHLGCDLVMAAECWLTISLHVRASPRAVATR